MGEQITICYVEWYNALKFSAGGHSSRRVERSSRQIGRNRTE